MKTKTLARRIASIVLAMMIVLSYALVSVSALPNDLTATGNVNLTATFEDGSIPSWIIPGGSSEGTLSVSSAQAHTGDDSMLLTPTGTQYSRFKIDGLEVGSSYYLSFWYYSTGWAGNVAGSGFASDYAFNSTTEEQWNKAWVTFTATATNTNPTFWGLVSGETLYVDDVELVKVSSAARTNNTVPAGATVSASGAYGFESGITATIPFKNKYSAMNASSAVVSVDIDNCHYGEASMKFVGTAGTDANPGFYINTTNTFNSQVTFEENGVYYLSYYVYTPSADVKVATYLFSSGNGIPVTEIPQGEWTKVSALFTCDATTAASSNKHLLRSYVWGTDSYTVYFDDFVLAKLTEMPAAAALTAGDVDYDFTANTAEATIASTVELASVATSNITASEGVTVTSADLSTDGTTITVGLSGVTLGESYTLTATGLTDAFGRAVEDTPVVVTMPTAAQAPMTISSSSVADGATGVAIVKELYFKVPYAVDEATVIASNFSITGFGASIAAVEKVADTEIKVTLDGIFPAETYVLSVDGVANTSGGVLKDRITFTTKAADYSYHLDFEVEELADLDVNVIKKNSGTMELSSEKAYTNNKSIKLTADNQYGGFAKIEIGAMKNYTTYSISCYVYSTTWKGSMANSQYGTWGTPVITEAENGWKKLQVIFTTGEAGGKPTNGGNMSFWSLGTDGVIYIDDIEVKELGVACQPTMRANGEYVTALADGVETSIEFTVNGAASDKTVTAFVITYGENNKMLSATPVTKTVAANTPETFTLSVTKAAGVTTKVIVMDAESYAPLYDLIQ